MSSPSYIPASEAHTAIRKVIAKGGSASLKVGDEFRCLQHFPSFDRPARRLLWPFSKLQPLRFHITRQKFAPGPVVSGVQFPSRDTGGPEARTEYSQTQIDEAIDTFLAGSKPDDEVAILIDSRL